MSSLGLEIERIYFNKTNRDRLIADIDTALRSFQSLQPNFDTYVSATGHEYWLLSLSGKVTLNLPAFNNLPLQIYFPQEYPQEPPIVFVRPERGLEIADHQPFVDLEGETRWPYLLQWNARTSSLVDMLRSLRQAFTEHPPFQLASSSSSPSSSSSSLSDPDLRDEISQFKTGLIQQEQKQEERQKHQLKQELQKKMTRYLQGRATQTNQQMDQLQLLLSRLESHQYDSSTGLPLNKLISAFEEKSAKADAALSTMSLQKKFLAEWLEEEAEYLTHLDPDTVVSVDSPFDQQQIDVVCSDATIEDTLFVLQRALQSESIEFPTYIRLVKELSREQFYCRLVSNRLQETPR